MSAVGAKLFALNVLRIHTFRIDVDPLSATKVDDIELAVFVGVVDTNCFDFELAGA